MRGKEVSVPDEIDVRLADGLGGSEKEVPMRNAKLETSQWTWRWSKAEGEETHRLAYTHP